MMGVLLVICGDVVFDRTFDRVHVFSDRDPGAISDTKDVCINRLRGHTPPHIQNHIGRLAPDPGKRLKRRAGIWNDTAIILDQNAAELDDVLGLLPIQTDGLDVFNQTLFTKRKHLFRRIRDLEQRTCRLVDANIGGLRRQCHSHNQRIGIHMLKLAFRLWLCRVKAVKDRTDLVISQLLYHADAMPVSEQSDKADAR